MATTKRSIKRASCTVCSHPERHRIEMARLAGASADSIAETFKLSRDSVYRHMRNHVSAETKAALIADVPLSQLAEKAAAESLSLLDYLQLLRSTLIGQALTAASVNDRHALAAVSGKALDVLKEIGKLTGELRNMPSHVTQNNFNMLLGSPAFAALETMLLERLTPFPDAMRAVMAGLDGLERAQEAQGRPMLTVEGSHALAA